MRKDTGTHLIITPKITTMMKVTVSKLHDDSILVPGRGGDKATQVVSLRNPWKKIGTWNVRTLLKDGKLKNAKREMERHQISI